jgi:steroid delta-isomerase-like uncharacterized protein
VPDDHKSILRRFYEEISAGNLEVIDELVADDVVEHEEFPGLEPNKEGVKQFFTLFRRAFPDLRMEPHEMLAEGDLVSARVTITGTHDGEFLGMAPTGKPIEVETIDMLRIRGGQAIEHWGVTDSMTMMHQLDAFASQAPG